MARSTRQRIPQRESFYADDDGSGEETETEETPKVAKQNIKRRFSELPIDNDPSFGSDSGRMPLKSVNMNDDEAEKRKRRKSAKAANPFHSDNAEAGPSSGGIVATDGLPPPVGGKQKQAQLASVAPTPIINVPFDVMSSNFEEWMKMATDNKINATNSWNFALIDYFHDMSLLRNNSDNSINFQRASCTLDGCVKIWTSRVDSVGAETGKLLSNLADEGNNLDDEEAGSDNFDGRDSQQTKRQRTHRPESTLAKNAAQLRSKKLDLEFNVDPLFKKTCADFDEGGAQGLLMNHLSLGVGSEGALRVVFDAGDSMAKDGEEDEDNSVLQPEEEVDLTEIRAQFIPNLDDLDEKAITPSLAGFSFSKDAFSFERSLFHDDTQADFDDDNAEGDGFTPMDVDGEGGNPTQVEDFFVGDQAVQDDFGGGDYGHDDVEGESGSAGAESGQQNGAARSGPFVPFDPGRAPNERDLVMAMTDADADGGMMNYFDQNVLKNWAGPEHWKLRKVVRKPENTEAAPKPRREKKEAFKIDFFTPSEISIKEFAKQKFAPVTRGAGINLPGHGPTATASKSSSKRGSKKSKEKDTEKRVEQVLPDDMHFSSRQLVTLYLKPKFSLKMRGQRLPTTGNGDGEIDENFWAQAAANQAVGQGNDGDETADGSAIPFNTQFFHDDYDDGPGFDDIDEGGGGEAFVDAEEQDLLAAVNGSSRRVRPQFVNYAKKAKRVDVKKLKENIWKGLKIVVPDEKEAEHDPMEIDEPSRVEPTNPSDPRVFDSVITNLRKSYPKEKMEEISTSFCFICLLHLANEKGLKIEVGDDGPGSTDIEVGDNRVGDIWGLKVFRDPNATPGA